MLNPFQDLIDLANKYQRQITALAKYSDSNQWNQFAGGARRTLDLVHELLDRHLAVDFPAAPPEYSGGRKGWEFDLSRALENFRKSVDSLLDPQRRLHEFIVETLGPLSPARFEELQGVDSATRNAIYQAEKDFYEARQRLAQLFPKKQPIPKPTDPSNNDKSVEANSPKNNGKATNGSELKSDDSIPSKKTGRKPLWEKEPIKFQVYSRIKREHDGDYTDTVARLKDDKDFKAQVKEAGVKIDTKLVKNALGFFVTLLQRIYEQIRDTHQGDTPKTLKHLAEDKDFCEKVQRAGKTLDSDLLNAALATPDEPSSAQHSTN